MTCSDQVYCCVDWEDTVDLTTKTFQGTWSLSDSSATTPTIILTPVETPNPEIPVVEPTIYPTPVTTTISSSSSNEGITIQEQISNIERFRPVIQQAREEVSNRLQKTHIEQEKISVQELNEQLKNAEFDQKKHTEMLQQAEKDGQKAYQYKVSLGRELPSVLQQSADPMNEQSVSSGISSTHNADAVVNDAAATGQVMEQTNSAKDAFQHMIDQDEQVKEHVQRELHRKETLQKQCDELQEDLNQIDRQLMELDTLEKTLQKAEPWPV